MHARSELFELVDREFSPDRARDLAASLTNYYRSPGSSGFLAATEQVEQALIDGGLDVTTRSYPFEGAWEPHDASLKVVHPGPVDMIDYETAPACIAWWSDATDGDEQLEVVDVGPGDQAAHYDDVDVEGKAVFVRGTPRRQGWKEASRLAAERGARGIITDYMLYQTPGVREPELVPDAAQLLRLQPGKEYDVWAFSIPHSASTALSELLAGDGRVTVEASVDAETFSSEVRNVEATIEGSELPEERVLFCAHTSGIKPGANCAEGVGLVTELARTLQALIDDGAIPRPRRSITFVIGAEGAVSGNYLADHPDAVENVVTTMTYCSAGHDQHETQSSLLLARSPDSVASYVNDYLGELLAVSPADADWIGKAGGRELPLVSCTDHYYTPWSDNTFFAANDMPAPLFMSWPDRYFHSQFLTEDVIDPSALRRSGLISGTAAIELADADAATAAAIATLVADRTGQRLHRAVANVDEIEDPARRNRQIEYLAEWGIEALHSVTDLVSDDATELTSTLDRHETRIQDAKAEALETVPRSEGERERPEFVHLVPVRTSDEDGLVRWAGLEYRDLLDIADMLAAADPEAGWRSVRVVSDETWNFIDGHRSVEDIADSVGFEFDLEIPPEPIYRILQGLADAGHVEFRQPS